MRSVAVSWDVELYRLECVKQKIWTGFQKKELAIEEMFPPIAPGIRSVRKPTTVIDKHGRIIAWILPDLLPSAIQVGVVVSSNNTLTNGLQVELQYCARILQEYFTITPRGEHQAKTWRYEKKLFAELRNTLPVGILNFSAGWFMAGWEVRTDVRLRVCLNSLRREGRTVSLPLHV